MRSTRLKCFVFAAALCVLIALPVLPGGIALFTTSSAQAFAPIPGYSELDWNQVASRGHLR